MEQRDRERRGDEPGDRGAGRGADHPGGSGRRRGGDASGREHVIPDRDRGEAGARQSPGQENPEHRRSFDRRAARHGGQQRYQPGHRRSGGDWQGGSEHGHGISSARARGGTGGRRVSHGESTWPRDQQDPGRSQYREDDDAFSAHGQQSVQRRQDRQGARSGSAPTDAGGGDGRAERARRSRGHPERHYREHLDR